MENAPKGGLMDARPEYQMLADALNGALMQAQDGKGKERHAEAGEPFEKQIILEVTRRLQKSPVAFSLGQAVKKIYETVNLGDYDAIAELEGAVNYLGAAIIRYKELCRNEAV